MANKRSNGEGSLRRRPNGLWECTIMIGFQDNGKRKYKSFYGKTQKEVKDKVQQYRENVAAGIEADEALTFRKWAQQWYDGYEGHVSPTTYEGYRYTLAILNGAFGDKKLRQIKAMDVENFLKKMISDGKSHSSATKCRGMLFQIFHKAEANDLIRKNPVRFADKMRDTGPKKKKDSFTAEEVRILFDKLPDNRIGNSIRLMLATGLRGQELLALQPEHIEPDGSCVHVRQAVKLVKGTVELGVPKSDASFRDVPVPLAVRPYAIALRNGCGGPFLWTDKSGLKPCTPSGFRGQFRKALEEIDGVRVLTPHSCRHAYVSQLQAQGVPLETIQALVGHAEVDMTEHYLHVQREVKAAAVEKLSALIA